MDEHEWRRAGHHMINEFVKENGVGGLETLATFVALVASNIAEHPEDDKYRKLKSSSQQYSAVARLRGASKVIEWLGFRAQVLEFQQWMVLRTSDEGWLEDLKKRAELVKEAHVKAVSAQKAQTAGKTKEAAKEEYANQVKARIQEARLEAMERKKQSEEKLTQKSK